MDLNKITMLFNHISNLTAGFGVGGNRGTDCNATIFGDFIRDKSDASNI